MECASFVPSGKLFVFQRGLVYLGRRIAPVFTKRQACVIVISSDCSPIEVKIENETTGEIETLSGHAFALAHNVKRSIKASGNGAVFVNFEPSHPMHFAIFTFLGQRPVARLGQAFESLLLKMVQPFVCAPDIRSAKVLFDNIVDLTQILCNEKPRDNRIINLIEKICVETPHDYRFEQLKRQTKLSSSRLSHLFSEHTGLSLRSFMQWRKIREAIVLFTNGNNLTEVAHEAGFSDSAHFCRTFKSCLGVNPSHFVGKNTISIEMVEA